MPPRATGSICRRSIDAQPDIAGLQRLDFVGTGPFDGVGQLRLAVQSNGVMVSVNLDDRLGDAEMSFTVQDVTLLDLGDFVL